MRVLQVSSDGHDSCRLFQHTIQPLYVLSHSIIEPSNTLSLRYLEQKWRRNQSMPVEGLRFSSTFPSLEIPCNRTISPMKENQCSSHLLEESRCEDGRYSFSFHQTSQIFICREVMTKKVTCFNDGLLIINDLNNGTTCSQVTERTNARQCLVSL